MYAVFHRLARTITQTDNEPTGFVHGEKDANDVNTVKAENILKERMKTECDY